jgi:hypothetical protein
MDAAYISGISALAGSVIGGLTSGFTTWLSQRSQARAGMIAHDLARREDLIRDFIIAASKTYGDAIINSEPKMPEIVDLYAMVSRMRALGMSKTTECADSVMRAIVDTYYMPKSDSRRSKGPGEDGRGHRSPEGLQRSGAPGAARVRNALRRRALRALWGPARGGLRTGDVRLRKIDNFLPSRLEWINVFQNVRQVWLTLLVE